MRARGREEERASAIACARTRGRCGSACRHHGAAIQQMCMVHTGSKRRLRASSAGGRGAARAPLSLSALSSWAHALAVNQSITHMCLSPTRSLPSHAHTAASRIACSGHPRPGNRSARFPCRLGGLQGSADPVSVTHDTAEPDPMSATVHSI